MFSSSSSNSGENMALMYQMALTAAQETVDLSTAYFVPDERNSKILIDAMQRGVKLHIITPGKNNGHPDCALGFTANLGTAVESWG